MWKGGSFRKRCGLSVAFAASAVDDANHALAGEGPKETTSGKLRRRPGRQTGMKE